MKKIVIGCDDTAVAFKEEMKNFLSKKGIEWEDLGVKNGENIHYPIIAQKICMAIIDSSYEKSGILICGTGIGMCMTANKFPGIFAAVCHDDYSAERMKLSNNGNVLCMGARVIGFELAKKILSEWLSLDYVQGGSSQPKVDLMRQIDAANVNHYSKVVYE